MTTDIVPVNPSLSKEQLDFLLDVLQQPKLAFTLDGARMALATFDALKAMRDSYGT